jgi:hypothetical protein
MKKIMLALVFVLFAKITIAQKELLSLDEHNKYIYYQVVDMPRLTADTLNNRALYFFKKEYPKNKTEATAEKVTGEGKFITYDGLSVLKHESGEITYQVTIECKNDKYRYWLTTFTFTPYQRDRYGSFVPQRGINIPFENASSKLDKKAVNSTLDQTGIFCKQLGDKLKLAMATSAPKKEESIKKVVTDKW